jgi:hypothetical protein
MSFLIAVIVGILVMVGLFSFFNTYPDPLYFETFSAPAHSIRDRKDPRQYPSFFEGYDDNEHLEEPGIF